MKKVYIAPSLEIVKVEMRHNLLADSDSIGLNDEIGGNSLSNKHNLLWDDEENDDL